MDIQRYPVIPLSPNTGVVGWVPHCDTLHDLIRDYRDRRKIVLNAEHKLMQLHAPNNIYDVLTAMQKLEVGYERISLEHESLFNVVSVVSDI